jgi:hypothetical protein
VPASYFNEGEAHRAATNAHGVTGNVVGTSGSQTIQDKTYRGAHRSLFSDALPAGVTASYESSADTAAARDGFVHRNTAGDVDRRGLLIQQSGVDRVQVFNDGTVDLNPGASARPGLRSRGTTQLDGGVTAGAAVTVTGATTLNGGVTVSGTAALPAVTATTVNATSVSTTGDIHAGGNLDTDGTLVVDGASTLTGAVATGALTVTGNTTISGTLTASSTDVLAAISTVNGKVLTTSAPARAYLLQDTLQPVSNGTWTAINFQVEDFDSANGHSTSVNITRYTATVAGKYKIGGKVSFEPNSTNARGVRVHKNGTVVAGSEVMLPTPSGVVACIPVPSDVFVELNGTTDYVEIAAWQNSGGSLDTSVLDAGKQSFMSVLLVRNNAIV